MLLVFGFKQDKNILAMKRAFSGSIAEPKKKMNIIEGYYPSYDMNKQLQRSTVSVSEY